MKKFKLFRFNDSEPMQSKERAFFIVVLVFVALMLFTVIYLEMKKETYRTEKEDIEYHYSEETPTKTWINQNSIRYIL